MIIPLRKAPNEDAINAVLRLIDGMDKLDVFIQKEQDGFIFKSNVVFFSNAFAFEVRRKLGRFHNLTEVQRGDCFSDVIQYLDTA